MDLQVVVTVGGTEVEEDGEKRREQDKTREIVKEDRGREEDTQEVIILDLVLVLIRTAAMEVLETRTVIQTPPGLDHITPEGDTGWLPGNNMSNEKHIFPVLTLFLPVLPSPPFLLLDGHSLLLQEHNSLS